MKQKIDWLNHGLEFIVVVIGILLAFQLNEWSVDRDEQQLVLRHLDNIEDELTFNTRTLEQAHESITAEIAIFEALTEQYQGEIDADKVNQLLLQVMNSQTVYIRTNAYSTLIETGDVRLIKDFELKGAIVNLYEFYRWTKSVDDGDFNFKQGFVYPFAIQHLDLLSGTTQATEVYEQKELKNIVGTMKFILQYREGKYQESIELTQQFKQVLDKHRQTL